MSRTEHDDPVQYVSYGVDAQNQEPQPGVNGEEDDGAGEDSEEKGSKEEDYERVTETLQWLSGIAPSIVSYYYGDSVLSLFFANHDSNRQNFILIQILAHPYIVQALQ